MPTTPEVLNNGDAAIVQEYPYSDYLQTPESFQRSAEAIVLHTVLQGAYTLKDCVNEKYLKAYLEERSEFRQLFLESWRDGSFEDIRNHEELIPLTQNANSNVFISASQFTEVHGDYYDIKIGEDDQAVLSWLSKFDYIPMQRDVYRRKAEGTGNWFLSTNEYIEWKSGAGSQILWCPGNPGSGKTILASVAIYDLQLDKDRPTLFVYFDFKRQRDQSIDMVLGCLARQVYEQIPQTRSAFKSAYEKYQSLHPSKALLIDLLRRYVGIPRKTVFIVLDALDEYLEKFNDRDFLDLMHVVAGLGTNVRLMVTSRVLGEMEGIFKNLDAARLEIREKETDISIYITSRVQAEIPFAEKICTKILEATLSSSNSFLSARLTMDRLCSLFNRGEILEELESLPESLDDAFRIVLKRIDGQVEARRALAQRILAWIALSMRPLKVRDLQEALAIAPGRLEVGDYIIGVDNLTGVCAGIVIIDRDSGLVRFVLTDQTANEYIRKSDYLHLGHSYIGKNCMTLIVNTLEKDEFVCGRNPYSHPLLDYALSSWGFHCIDDEEGLLDGIIAFLSDTRVVKLLSEKILPDPDFSFDMEGEEEGSVVHVASYFVLTMTLAHFLAKGHPLNGPSKVCGLTPIALAAYSGHRQMASLLLEKDGVDLNSPNKFWGGSPLTLAANIGNEEIMDMLFQRGVDINSKDRNGTTPLIHAAAYGGLRVSQKLLEWGAAIDVTDGNGGTALIHAVEHGQTEVTQLLLDAGARLPDIKGMIAITEWCDQTDLDALKLLLQRCPELAKLKDSNNRTILSHACSSKSYGRRLFQWADGSKDLKLAETFLEFLPDIADIQLVDADLRSPLSYALEDGQHLLADKILHRIHQESKYEKVLDKFGRSDVCYAVQSRAISAILHFLRHDIDSINSRDEDGATLLIHAAKGPRHEREFNTGAGVAELLIERGANIHAADKSGRAALSYAARNLDERLVELLLKAGANPQEHDNEGRVPLFYVLEFRDPITFAPGSQGIIMSVTKLLLEYGAKTDVQDNQGKTLLSCAATYGSIQLLELFSDEGVDITDKFGRSALWYVASQVLGYEWFMFTEEQGEVVRWLLNRGADPMLIDKQGESPQTLAEAWECPDLAELFHAHTAKHQSPERILSEGNCSD